jgi:adenine-specific DNA-methyltransferase
MAAYSGRLELTWTNKNKTLIAHDNGRYEWVDPADYRACEVRLLHRVSTVGEVQPNWAGDSLLIRGDALYALQSLNRLPEFAREYLGKVRLCYIDPPFNTGQAFEQYDDNLEHSVWLTMLRDRLVQIKPLLAPNASVWVHLDDTEAHRGRCVLDEVFGTGSFVTTIAWQKRTSRDNRAAFSSAHDYIHVYAPSGASAWKEDRNRLPDTAAYGNPDDDPQGPWRSVPLSAQAGHATSAQFYDIVTPTGRVHPPPDGRCWTYARPRFEELLAQGRVYWPRGGDGRPRLKKYRWEDLGLVPFTIWPAAEVGENSTAKGEIAALFGKDVIFDTPKPEALLKRIIHIASNPGDVVLDCFVGSGTTAAVAHKMGRRWVAIEWRADTVARFALPRLTKVINGEDSGGVTAVETPIGDGLPESLKPGEAREAARILSAMSRSGMLDDVDGLDDHTLKALTMLLRSADRVQKEIIWQGGGGFHVVEVGPSMFEAVEGRVYLADWATNGALGEAVAAQLGYEPRPDPPFVGAKGRTRLAVIDGLVNTGVIRLLVDALADDQSLLVCGTAIDPDAHDVLRKLRPGSKMKKIPAGLLDEYRLQRRERLDLASLLDWTEASLLLDMTERRGKGTEVRG